MHAEVEAALAMLSLGGCLQCGGAVQIEGEAVRCRRCGDLCPFCGASVIRRRCAHVVLGPEDRPSEIWSYPGLAETAPKPAWPLNDARFIKPVVEGLPPSLVVKGTPLGWAWRAELRLWALAVSNLWRESRKPIATTSILDGEDEYPPHIFVPDPPAFVAFAQTVAEDLRRRAVGTVACPVA